MTPQVESGLAQISREIVQLLRSATGRGPTKCRADYANDDLLVVSLQEGTLASERTLSEAGEDLAVDANRAALQNVLADRLTEIVERVTDRNVTAFLSANNADPDFMIEAFVLEPVEQPAAHA